MDGFDTTVDAPRGGTTREWELFCRETATEPLVHAGSVSAPTAEIAREQAEKLFDHAVEALWLCPADETVRLREGSLDATADAASGSAAERPAGAEE